jgi:hypothetical protein
VELFPHLIILLLAAVVAVVLNPLLQAVLVGVVEQAALGQLEELETLHQLHHHKEIMAEVQEERLIMVQAVVVGQVLSVVQVHLMALLVMEVLALHQLFLEHQ